MCLLRACSCPDDLRHRRQSALEIFAFVQSSISLCHNTLEFLKWLLGFQFPYPCFEVGDCVACPFSYSALCVAIVRSNLWSTEAQVPKGTLPSAGQMLAATDEAFDASAYDREAPERVARTIY